MGALEQSRLERLSELLPHSRGLHRAQKGLGWEAQIEVERCLKSAVGATIGMRAHILFRLFRGVANGWHPFVLQVVFSSCHDVLNEFQKLGSARIEGSSAKKSLIIGKVHHIDTGNQMWAFFWSRESQRATSLLFRDTPSDWHKHQALHISHNLLPGKCVLLCVCCKTRRGGCVNILFSESMYLMY